MTEKKRENVELDVSDKLLTYIQCIKIDLTCLCHCLDIGRAVVLPATGQKRLISFETRGKSSQSASK